MKKYFKAIIYRLPSIFIFFIMGLIGSIILEDVSLNFMIIAGICFCPIIAIADVIDDNRVNKLEKFEKAFNFLIKDLNYKIDHRQFYDDIEICGQITYVNEKYKITIMADENVRIIISDIKSLVVYYDITEFGEYSKKNCKYQEKIDKAVTWLRKKLSEDFNE